MKRILVVTLLGLSLIMTACSEESIEKESEDDFPPTMGGIIEVNGKQYDIATGNYKWERKEGMETQVIATDAASPYQIADDFKAILIGQSETIHINVEAEPTITVYLWDENGRQKKVSVSNNQIKAPENAGKYVFEVLAEWSNGEVSYTFVVEIK